MDLNDDGRVEASEVIRFTQLEQAHGIDLADIARSLDAAGVRIGTGSAQEIADGMQQFVSTPAQQAAAAITQR
ncbi:MAG: hypothetical protein J0M34_00410 [Alphaproteobacteria bacterium]|nr:hypothetical protein [Alphaproteobacteria bacterium]